MKTLALIALLACTGASYATTYLETFPDPLGQWQSGWLYQNTNMESYYYASGDCNPDQRGNQLDGIWISDDQGCGGMLVQSPVRIDFAGGFGDTGTNLAFDFFTCVDGVTLNIYDKDGALAVSQGITPNCFVWGSYSFALANGVSAFEFAYTGGQVEGNSSIDNVQLDTGGGGPPVVCIDFDGFCDGLELGKSGRNITGYWRNTDCAGTDVAVRGKIVGREGRVLGDLGFAVFGFVIDGLPLDGSLTMYIKDPNWMVWIDPLTYTSYNGPCLFDEGGAVSSTGLK